MKGGHNKKHDPACEHVGPHSIRGRGVSLSPRRGGRGRVWVRRVLPVPAASQESGGVAGVSGRREVRGLGGGVGLVAGALALTGNGKRLGYCLCCLGLGGWGPSRWPRSRTGPILRRPGR